jgi:hypothetical protein
MPTNLALKDRLSEVAKKLGRYRTKREAVNAALGEYIQYLKQRQIVSLLGTIDRDD